MSNRKTKVVLRQSKVFQASLVATTVDTCITEHATRYRFFFRADCSEIDERLFRCASQVAANSKVVQRHSSLPITDRARLNSLLQRLYDGRRFAIFPCVEYRS